MIQKRNMWAHALLYIVTLELYGVYWFYVTTKEILQYKKLEGDAAVWTVLLLLPLVGCYSMWKQGEAVEALTDGRYNKVVIFVLWLVFCPAVWYVTQQELNKVASAQLEA